VDKLISELILKELAEGCEFLEFGRVNYFVNYSRSISFTPKHLKLFACGQPSGTFLHNPLEGYRTLFPIKITQTTPLLTKPTRLGGDISFNFKPFPPV
jgi:hypothetical protein